MWKHWAALLWPLSLTCLADNTIVGTGFGRNSDLAIAPGQILRLDVRGIGASLTGTVTASGYPWPTKLVGISVTLHLHYSIFTTDVTDVSAPILSVERLPGCLNNNVFPTQLVCTQITSVIVQIPYSVPVNGTAARLTVSENGVPGNPVDIFAQKDAINAIAVLRSDWTIVSALNPADPGENLALFAYGLGLVSPAVDAGQPAPNQPAVVNGLFRLSYDVRYEAPPYRDAANLLPEIQPTFVGLSPGVPGLYQINFQAPAVPAGNQGCPVIGGIIFSIVYHSNVTINLRGPHSFDGIGICVKPQS
jgi:uncharacterized protein (TIGR03437 family)